MPVQTIIKPTSGELFTSSRGNLWTLDGLSHRWTLTLRRAGATPEEQEKDGKKVVVNADGLDLPILKQIPAHRLRSSFATMASNLGCPDRVIKGYMGHCPTDVLGGHYLKITMADLKSVSTRMNAWKSLSDSNVSWQESGNLEADEAVKG